MNPEQDSGEKKNVGICQWPGLKSADLDSSDKWQSGFQGQAIAMGCGERHTQKAKREKPVHKRCLWNYNGHSQCGEAGQNPKT